MAHADLQFDSDASRRFVPLVVAAMVYLAALALAGSMAIGGAVASWSEGLRGTLTVQLPAGDKSGVLGHTDTAIATLLQTPGVKSAEPLPDSKIQGLLEPWLGEGVMTAGLPVPVLIDVILEPGESVDIEALSQSLRAVVPGAQVNDNGVWLERLIRFARSIQWVAAIVVLLVGTAAVAIIVFATRAGLSVHRDTIELLHIIGARDSYVANQFQTHLLFLALIGGVIGLVLAGLTLLVLAMLAGQVQAPLLPQMNLSVQGWVLLVALPFIASGITMLTARLTVIQSLRRFL